MEPIVRHTITITVVETWTITWDDGHEKVWHETHEVVLPALNEATTPLPAFTGDDQDEGVIEGDTADERGEES